MALIRHKLLLAIFKWVLFTCKLVLWGNQLSSEFYIHSNGPLAIVGHVKKAHLNFSSHPNDVPIQKYNTCLSIDKRYFEPGLVALHCSTFRVVSPFEQEIVKYIFLKRSPVKTCPRVAHLRGPPVC